MTLAYDPLGRLWRTSGGAYGVTDFLYDGDALVAEYDGATGALRRRYAHGPDADEPILWDEGSAMNCSATRYLHRDHQGSVVALSDCSGARVATNAYDDFGIPNASNFTSSMPQRFQYTGQAWIPELGMYHYKARVYSPTLGRFLQTDPIGYDDQINLYAYVGNDPVNGRDPSGMQTVQDMQLQMQIDDMRQQGMSQQQIDKVVYDQGVMQAKALVGMATLAIPVEALVVKGLGWAARALGITEKVAPAIKAGSAGGETAGKVFPPSC